MIYYEEVRMHLGIDAGHAYGGYLAVLQMFCEERKIPYEGLGVGAIKKEAVGKGVASKDQMLDAAVKRFPSVNITDHNHADALFVWALGMKRSSASVVIDFSL